MKSVPKENSENSLPDSQNGFSIQDGQVIPKEKLSPSQESLQNELKTISQIYETVEEDIHSQGTKPSYEIGLKDLDDILWGVHKRELTVIGGYPSQGKSDFMINLAHNLADTGKRVIIFSLEMSKEQIVKRLICKICGIDNQALRKGNAKEQIKAKRHTFLDATDNARLLIDDKHGYSLSTALEVCDIIKPDFVFVDYIQMIRTERGKTKLDAIEDYVRAMKEYANEHNVGIILLSQRNKDGDLKWGRILEEHPDTVLLLYWDWERNHYEVSVKKQRHGFLGKCELDYKPQFSLFGDKGVKGEEIFSG